MSNPNDDPDVISGLCDDAKKEMATTPGTSQVASASVLLCGGIRLVLGLRMGLGVGYRLDMTQCRLSSDLKLK